MRWPRPLERQRPDLCGLARDMGVHRIASQTRAIDRKMMSCSHFSLFLFLFCPLSLSLLTLRTHVHIHTHTHTSLRVHTYFISRPLLSSFSLSLSHTRSGIYRHTLLYCCSLLFSRARIHSCICYFLYFLPYFLHIF